jgi:Uma2 family endonuclease
VTEAARQLFSFYDYVLVEEMSPIKHEFLEGQVWAMAGGTPERAAVAAAVIGLLHRQLEGQPCRVFSSDLRIRVQATGLGTYPDASVVCGALELDPDDPKRHTVTNPRVLVEVLSPSTADYDRGEKLSHYQRISSVQDIVLVSHDARRIDVWCRVGDSWKQSTVQESGTVTLRSISCVLSLEAVYRDPLE